MNKNTREVLGKTDKELIKISSKFAIPTLRLSLFVIFFWFGILKVFGLSPANPLVESLLYRITDIISFADFSILFGVFEVIIGICFVIIGFERIGIMFLVFHLILTTLPLFLLPEMVWQKMFVPTLEGQYIIKNTALLSLALVLGSHLSPYFGRREWGHFLKK